jgi:DNA polymerase III psi subunit
MSLDNIQLPAFVIQDLFRKNLVDTNSNEKKEAIAGSEELNFFGGNKQHIILLVNNPDAVFVTDQQLTFLSGILTACKLTLEDVGLINIVATPIISYKAISKSFKPRIVIMFGISPEAIELPFVMPLFQKQLYNNQVYLTAPSLSELENNKDQKRNLWTVLQQIFSL